MKVTWVAGITAIIGILMWILFSSCTSQKMIKYECPEQLYWKQLQQGLIDQDEYVSLLRGCDDLKAQTAILKGCEK